MDFSTLPEEMVRNVVKYMKIGNIAKLRKINHRIDQVARRNKLCQFAVDELRFVRRRGLLTVKPHISEAAFKYLGLSNATAPIFTEKTSLHTLLGKCFPSFEARKEVIFENFQLREEEFTTLYENRHHFQKVTKLSFYKLQLQLCTDSLKTLFSEVFPKVDTLHINISEIDQEISLTEATSIRKWKKLHLGSEFQLAIPTNEEFLKAFAQSQEVQLEHVNIHGFTVSDMIELVKKCITIDGKFTRRFKFGLVDIGDVARNDIKSTIEFHIPGMVSHGIICVRPNFGAPYSSHLVRFDAAAVLQFTMNSFVSYS